MSSIKTLEMLSLLTPCDIIGADKLRIGYAYDGGYIMLDAFDSNYMVFSYGLSWNIYYDLDLAKRGMAIKMFDHTIDALTMEHSNFEWVKQGLGTEQTADGVFDTLENHVARFAKPQQKAILKVDIEGAEWDVFSTVPEETLLRFDQIVIEFHDVSRHIAENSLVFRNALERLNKFFDLFHVHANNCSPVVQVHGFPIPDTLEISYVRRGRFQTRPNGTIYPSSIDAPNDHKREDIPLLGYPFFPVASQSQLERFKKTFAADGSSQKTLPQKSIAALIPPAPAPSAQGKTLSILLKSIHPVLEFDDIRMLEGLGHRVFSLGFFLNRSPTEDVRPALDAQSHVDEMLQLMESEGITPTYRKTQRWVLTRAMLDRFDVILVHYDFAFIKYRTPTWSARDLARNRARGSGNGGRYFASSWRRDQNSSLVAGTAVLSGLRGLGRHYSRG